MPEFDCEIIDLDRLNRKVDANRQRRFRAHCRAALCVLIVQLACLLAALGSIALRISGLLPAWLSSCAVLLATIVSVFASGWYHGYEKGSAV